MSIENCEQAAEKDINWYMAQAEELKAIRKHFWEICGDTANGKDAYFPDLVAAELRKVGISKINLNKQKLEKQ